MRRKIIIFFLVNLTVVSFLVHSFWPLICLLVEDGAQDQISRAEIPAPNSGRIEELHQVIPKIIHQTFITCDTQPYLNGTCATRQIPQVWEAVQNSCKELHKDYEYKVRWESTILSFLEFKPLTSRSSGQTIIRAPSLRPSKSLPFLNKTRTLR